MIKAINKVQIIYLIIKKYKNLVDKLIKKEYHPSNKFMKKGGLNHDKTYMVVAKRYLKTI